MRIIPVVILWLIFAVSCHNSTTKAKVRNGQSLGPENGTLFIGGGGITDAMWKVYFNLAGADNAKLVVIPTAFDEPSIDYDPAFRILERKFRAIGFTDVQFLHTRDTLEANSPDFVAPLKTATAVWLSGGRQWRLADTYLNTKTLTELRGVLNRGGIIGGHSAGASIQGSYLVRGSREQDGNYDIISNPDLGFGFISNCAIDQHHLERNRQFDMFELLEIRPELLGLGIDKNTAIVVHKNEFEVIGERYVAIYDGTFWSDYYNTIDTLETGKNRFYLLENGDKYNLRERRVQRNRFLTEKPIPLEQKIAYLGTYLFEKSKVLFHKILMENDSLKFQVIRRNIVGDPIPLYAFEKDVFYDTDGELWFHFQRDSTGKLIGFHKKTHQYIHALDRRFRKVDE